MSESDYDIKIKLATSYDAAGEQAAAEGLERVKQETAETTAEAVQEVGRQAAEVVAAVQAATEAFKQQAEAKVAAAERSAAATRKAKVATDEAAAAEEKLKRPRIWSTGSPNAPAVSPRRKPTPHSPGKKHRR